MAAKTAALNEALGEAESKLGLRDPQPYRSFIPQDEVALGCLEKILEAWREALRKGASKKEMQGFRDRMSEVIVRWRDAPFSAGFDEQCVGRLKDGSFCRGNLSEESDCSSNLQLCQEHLEEHAFLRALEDDLESDEHYEHQGFPEVEEKNEGECCICDLHTPDEDDLGVACRMCGVYAHSGCIMTQLEGGTRENVADDENIRAVCSGCVVERKVEVELMLGAMASFPGGFLVFEPTRKAAYMEPSNSKQWTSAKKWAATWGVVAKAKEVTASPLAASRIRSRADVEVRPGQIVAAVHGGRGRGGDRGGRAAPGTGREPQQGPAEEEHTRQTRAQADGNQGYLEAQIEQLRERIEAQQISQGKSELPPALVFLQSTEEHSSVFCVFSTHDGYQRDGLVNSTKEAYFDKYDFLGMRAADKAERSRMKRLINAERVDLQTECSDCAESKDTSSTFSLGDEEMQIKASRAKKGTPTQANVHYYWTQSQEDLLRLRDCGQEVYAREHPDYGRFQYLCTGVLARLEVLEEIMRFLLQQGYGWELVWRYLCLFANHTFYNVPLGVKAEFDRVLVAAYVANPRRQRIAALASASFNPVYMQAAQRLMSTPVQAALSASQSGGSNGSRGRGGSPKRGPSINGCPLCLSPDHAYSKTKGYGHVGDITVACGRMCTDGRVCGLRHAFTGPLASDCRAKAAAWGRK